jgi:hypothetical protein
LQFVGSMAVCGSVLQFVGRCCSSWDQRSVFFFCNLWSVLQFVVDVGLPEPSSNFLFDRNLCVCVVSQPLWLCGVRTFAPQKASLVPIYQRAGRGSVGHIIASLAPSRFCSATYFARQPILLGILFCSASYVARNPILLGNLFCSATFSVCPASAFFCFSSRCHVDVCVCVCVRARAHVHVRVSRARVTLLTTMWHCSTPCGAAQHYSLVHANEL